jgi:UDP-glucose 4-epimerase
VAIFSHHLWSGTQPTVYGNGTPTRDYIHVADVVRSMRLASGRRGVFNVPTETETDVLGVLAYLQPAAGTSIDPILKPLRAGELLRSCLKTDRAREVLGFAAEISLEDGLRSTYQAMVEEFEARPA